mgnify:CR=1 FL=1
MRRFRERSTPDVCRVPEGKSERIESCAGSISPRISLEMNGMTDEVARKVVRRYAQSSSLPTEFTALVSDLSDEEVSRFPQSDEYLWRSRNDQGDLVLVGLNEIFYRTGECEGRIPWTKYGQVFSAHSENGKLKRPKEEFDELVIQETLLTRHRLHTQKGSDHFALYGLLVKLQRIAERNAKSDQGPQS